MEFAIVKRWLGLLVIPAVIGSCSDSPTAPASSSSNPCTPAALPAISAADAVAPAVLNDALQDASTRMSAGLGTGAQVQSVQNAIRTVETSIAAPNNSGVCGKITIAADRVDALPDDPASLPDRDAIRLVLALAAQSISVASGQ
jgi:hypothetical protein